MRQRRDTPDPDTGYLDHSNPYNSQYFDHSNRRRVSFDLDCLTPRTDDDDHDYLDKDTLGDPFIQLTDDFSVSRQPETQFPGCEPTSTIYLGQRQRRRVSFQDDDHDYLDTPMFTYDDNQRFIP